MKILKCPLSELEQMRDEDIDRKCTFTAFESFKGTALAATRDHPPEPTSGLVEQNSSRLWISYMADGQILTEQSSET